MGRFSARPRLRGQHPGQLVRGPPLLRPPPGLPRRRSRPAPGRAPAARAPPAPPLRHRHRGAAPRTGHGSHYRSLAGGAAGHRRRSPAKFGMDDLPGGPPKRVKPARGCAAAGSAGGQSPGEGSPPSPGDRRQNGDGAVSRCAASRATVLALMRSCPRPPALARLGRAAGRLRGARRRARLRPAAGSRRGGTGGRRRAATSRPRSPGGCGGPRWRGRSRRGGRWGRGAGCGGGWRPAGGHGPAAPGAGVVGARGRAGAAGVGAAEGGAPGHGARGAAGYGPSGLDHWLLAAASRRWPCAVADPSLRRTLPATGTPTLTRAETSRMGRVVRPVVVQGHGRVVAQDQEAAAGVVDQRVG